MQLFASSETLKYSLKQKYIFEELWYDELLTSLRKTQES